MFAQSSTGKEVEQAIRDCFPRIPKNLFKLMSQDALVGLELNLTLGLAASHGPTSAVPCIASPSPALTSAEIRPSVAGPARQPHFDVSVNQLVFRACTHGRRLVFSWGLLPFS